MENTWIADPSELPSPILKEGDTPLSRANSCEGNDDSSIKTSSPIISPSSLRTVNYSCKYMNIYVHLLFFFFFYN